MKVLALQLVISLLMITGLDAMADANLHEHGFVKIASRQDLDHLDGWFVKIAAQGENGQFVKISDAEAEQRRLAELIRAAQVLQTVTPAEFAYITRVLQAQSPQAQ